MEEEILEQDQLLINSKSLIVLIPESIADEVGNA
jgi:hypothetical protein